MDAGVKGPELYQKSCLSFIVSRNDFNKIDFLYLSTDYIYSNKEESVQYATLSKKSKKGGKWDQER